MESLDEVLETPQKSFDVNNEAENDSGHVTESDDSEVVGDEHVGQSDPGDDDEQPELQIGKLAHSLLML